MRGRKSSLILALFIGACGGSPLNTPSTGAAGSTGPAGTTGAAGSTGTAGSTSTDGSMDAAGSTGTAGIGGDAGATDTAGATGTAGAAGTAGTTGIAGADGSGMAGTTGTAGTGTANLSSGCGEMPDPADSSTRFVKKDIMVTGVDPAFIAAHPPNAGSQYSWTKRNYFVRLPKGYDPNTPVAVDMAEGGCGGIETAGMNGEYTLPAVTGQTEAIQIGLSYVDSSSVDMDTCAGYDDYDFVNSPEPEYIDTVIDDIATKYCVDKNKIFMNGYDTGAFKAVMSGCTNQEKVRAYGVQIGGGLAIHHPPCLNKPVAAMFVVGLQDTFNPIGPLATAENDSFGSALARDELLKRNGCVAADFQIVDTCSAGMSFPPCAAGIVNGDTFGNAPHAMWNEQFPKCQMYTGCPAKFPVVWCPLEVNHGNGPNPMGSDGGAIIAMYRLTAMWQFFSSLPPE